MAGDQPTVAVDQPQAAGGQTPAAAGQAPTTRRQICERRAFSLHVSETVRGGGEGTDKPTTWQTKASFIPGTWDAGL